MVIIVKKIVGELQWKNKDKTEEIIKILLSNEKKMAIYVYTNQRDGGIAHIPSYQEFVDLKNIMDGLSLTTWNDYKEKLHIPFTGDRRGSGSVTGQGNNASLWSSSLSGNDAYYLSINSSNSTVTHSYRSFGFCVRCLRDEYVNPDNTWTVEAGTLWGAGIFHNSTLWLISLTNGSDKNITIKDKNEWATVVYNDGDTLSESNCWKYYQRWNYYWFPFTWTVTTSSTKVNTTWYGGSNPYYGDTFINAPSSDWSNPKNDNLRADSWDEYFVIQ